MQARDLVHRRFFEKLWKDLLKFTKIRMCKPLVEKFSTKVPHIDTFKTRFLLFNALLLGSFALSGLKSQIFCEGRKIANFGS